MLTGGSAVEEAVNMLRLSEQVRRLPDQERDQVVRLTRAAFLDSPRGRFWWEHFRIPHASWYVEDAFKLIPELTLDAKTPCWLITDLEDDGHFVFECPPLFMPDILGECHYFEYAVVDPAIQWILIENHHNALFAAGADLPERLISARDRQR